MIEQNARFALAISDYGIVLELGQTRLVDQAERVLNDSRIGELSLDDAMRDSAGKMMREAFSGVRLVRVTPSPRAESL
jgi:hypothetical protein